MTFGKGTCDIYLKSHFDEDVNLSKIYRYMDKLYSTQKDIVQKVSLEHTFSVLGGRVEMLFYDVTSLLQLKKGCKGCIQ